MNEDNLIDQQFGSAGAAASRRVAGASRSGSDQPPQQTGSSRVRVAERPTGGSPAVSRLPVQERSQPVTNRAAQAEADRPAQPTGQHPAGSTASASANNAWTQVDQQAQTLALPGPSLQLRLRTWLWLLLVVLVLGAGSYFLLGYWPQRTAEMHFGSPPLDRAYLRVGHEVEGGPDSFFLALNLGGQVVAVEFKGSDPSQGDVIAGPYLFGKGEENTPARLGLCTVSTVSGGLVVKAKDGTYLPHLVIETKGQNAYFVNTGSEFRQATNDEATRLDSSCQLTLAH